MIGVYFLMQGEEIVYVGQSRDITNRIADHKAQKKKVFDSYRYILCDESDLLKKEAIFIDRLKPKYNGVPGRPKSKYPTTHLRVRADLVPLLKLMDKNNYFTGIMEIVKEGSIATIYLNPGAEFNTIVYDRSNQRLQTF